MLALPNLLTIDRNENKGFIYILIDPNTNLPVYVGRTKDIAGRLAHHSFHINEYAIKRQENKTKWILELKKQKKYPILQVIEICEESQMKEKEKYWINFLKQSGIELFNIDGYLKNRKPHIDRPVLVYNKDGSFFKEYISTLDVYDDLKIDARYVQSVLHNMRPTSCGYYFRYKTEDIYPLQIRVPGKYFNSNKPILQIDKVSGKIIKEFSDYKEAVKELNIRREYITRALRYEKSSAGGFIWRFKNKEDKEIAIKECKTLNKKYTKSCFQYNPINLDLIAIHKSVAEIAIPNNWSCGTLSNYCRCNALGYGFIWSYEEISNDEKNRILETQQAKLHNISLKRKLNNIKSVYTYNLEKTTLLYEFNSITECAKFFGTSSTVIKKSCDTNTQNPLGLIFSFEKLHTLIDNRDNSFLKNT